MGLCTIYSSSENRMVHLREWTHMYNWHRPHGGLKSETPTSRLGLNRDNLLRLQAGALAARYFLGFFEDAPARHRARLNGRWLLWPQEWRGVRPQSVRIHREQRRTACGSAR